MLLFVIIYLFIPFSGEAASYKSYKDHKVYEITGNTNDIRNLITNLTRIADVPHHGTSESSAKVMIAPELITVFSNSVQSYNLHKEMVVEDFSKIIEHEKQAYRRSRSSFSWTAYYDVDDIYGFLKNMSDTYPQWATVVEGGQTYENRKILGLRINTPTNKNKKTVFIESGIHAREWIAPATTTYFINQLLTSSDPAITSLRDKFDWHIFPTINPDGYHYSFNTHGSSTDPCDSQIYAGAKAFSEVETRTLSQYISSLKDLVGYISFHSYATLILIPLSDSVEHVSNYDDLMKIGKTSIEYCKKVNGTVYSGPGTAASVLYSVSGGSMDWVRYTLNVPVVFTFELRGDDFHWPPERIPEQGNEVTQLLLGLFTEACNLRYC